MIKQIVLTEQEYEEIEKMHSEYVEMKERLIALEIIKNEYIEFRKAVSQFFLDENGEFSYYETGPYYPNHLRLNCDVLADLFNHFFEDDFYKETRLKVDSYWKFKDKSISFYKTATS